MSKNISFVSEAQIEEKRQRRLEEWAKTRKEDDPEEPPEEKYDSRTLYERLQEQKLKKQEEYEESKKLKNLIKVLDNDEIDFLEAIDNSKAVLENQKYKEELAAIEEYKHSMVNLNAEEQDKKLLEFKRELFQLHKKKTDEKNGGEPGISTKRKISSQAALVSRLIKRKVPTAESNSAAIENNTTDSNVNVSKQPAKMPTIQCIGRLPGIGCYDDNSDSCDSDRESDEDEVEDFVAFQKPTIQTQQDNNAPHR